MLPPFRKLIAGARDVCDDPALTQLPFGAHTVECSVVGVPSAPVVTMRASLHSVTSSARAAAAGTVRPSVSAVFARRDYITLRRLTRIPCLGEGLSNAREKCYGACGTGAVET